MDADLDLLLTTVFCPADDLLPRWKSRIDQFERALQHHVERGG